MEGRLSPLQHWLDSSEDRAVGFAALPRRTSSPESFFDPRSFKITPIGSPTLSTASTLSSSDVTRKSSVSDALSRKSSASTAPSSAPSEIVQQPLHIQVAHTDAPLDVAPIASRFDLPCDLTILGCEIAFHPDRFNDWIAHSLSHFGPVGPPPKTICTFCDLHEATFETNGNRTLNWRTRMFHILDHLENGLRLEDMRPDFFIVEYMKANGLLSREDYEFAMQYTERPQCNGLRLVPLDYKTPEMEKRERRDNTYAQVHDSRKEDHRRQNKTRRGPNRTHRPPVLYQ